MKKPRIFIACHQEDRAWARDLAAALQALEVIASIAQNNVSEKIDLRKELKAAFNRCDVYALVIGKRTLSSTRALFDLGAAAVSDTPVIPIFRDTCGNESLTAFYRIQKIYTEDPIEAAQALARIATDLAEQCGGERR